MNYKNIYKCNDSYLVPNVMEQTNIVKECDVATNHRWSNTTGYGNIKVSSANLSRKCPWNRIPSLTPPLSTPINPKHAWDMKNLN